MKNEVKKKMMSKLREMVYQSHAREFWKPKVNLFLCSTDASPLRFRLAACLISLFAAPKSCAAGPHNESAGEFRAGGAGLVRDASCGCRIYNWRRGNPLRSLIHAHFR
jgi:hypothetical protein